MEAEANLLLGLERATVEYVRRERNYIYHNLLLSMALLLFTLVDMAIIVAAGLGRKGHIVFPPFLYMAALAVALWYYYRTFKQWDSRLKEVFEGDRLAPNSSMTNIYYELIDFAENRKWQFYLIYLGFVPFLLGGLYAVFVEGVIGLRFLLLDIILIAQLMVLTGGMVYLAVQVNHDLAWRRKVKKLEALEKAIGEEIGPVEDD